MRWLPFLSWLLLVLPGAGRAAECAALPAAYDGPIFDANVQVWTPEIQDLLAAAPRAGVERLALFANSRAGGAEAVAAVLKAAREHPDLVVPGAPKIGFIQGGDLPGDFVALTVAGIADGTYKFVGEILYTHGDKPDHPPTRHGEIHLDPLGAETRHLLEGLAGRDAPLLTHWEAWAWERDRLRFDRLYASWPQQRFVVPSLVYGSPEKADALLSMHPNLWGTLSRLIDGRVRLVDPDKMAKLGPVMVDGCGALTPAWRAVLLKHADRLMYGSDDYATERTSWESYPRIIARYRKIAGQLPPDIARKISWDTAAALYGTAR